MDLLNMELRDVRPVERVVIGMVSPYDETSYLTPDPNGERIRRGAFAKSIAQRQTKIPLLRNHDRASRMGVSRSFAETPEGLLGEFVVNEGGAGDQLLEDARNGYLGAMSAGFMPLGQLARGSDGVREVAEAKLVEVSLVALPAYEGSGMLSVRHAGDIDELLKPFQNPPVVNLAPLPPFGYRR
jgi:HK97 family phage prohead protease